MKQKICIMALCLMAFSAQAQNQRGLDYWNNIEGEAVETETGLQYKIVHLGKGRKPSSSSSRVKVHYRGMLLNGLVFDTSYDQDEPVSMNLRNTIKGWRQGIPLMPKGSTFVFLIPPELAYGPRGSSGIPPDSTLIFEVELY